MLILYRRVVFGPQENKAAAAMEDLDKRELGLLTSLVVLVIWLGVSPTIVTDRIAPSVDKLLTDYHAKLALAAEPAAGEER